MAMAAPMPREIPVTTTRRPSSAPCMPPLPRRVPARRDSTVVWAARGRPASRTIGVVERPPRCVVVGAGAISWAWFPPLKAEGVEVAAVVELDAERARQRLAQHDLQ